MAVRSAKPRTMPDDSKLKRMAQLRVAGHEEREGIPRRALPCWRDPRGLTAVSQPALIRNAIYFINIRPGANLDEKARRRWAQAYRA